MYDFDTLEKKCKLYHFKKFLLLAVTFIALLGAGVYILRLDNNNQKKEKPLNTKKYKKQNKVTIQKKSPVVKKEIKKIEKNKIEKKVDKKNTIINKTSKSTKTVFDQENNKCYMLQFFVSKKNKTKYIYLNKEKLTKLGFKCYIYAGKELLHLVCDKTRDYNKFLDSKKMANKYNLKFVPRKVMCGDIKNQEAKSFLKEKNTTSPKIAPQIVPQTKAIQPESNFAIKTKKYDISSLKKLFYERKSYNLALKIARYYYEAKDYDSAIKWSKTANSIDKTDDKSWIIYAKSLYAKKEYDKAKKILEIYMQFENSSKVSDLLAIWSNK